MSRYSQFLVACSNCGGSTSKPYARAHGGNCKPCATGTIREPRGFKCPTCGENTLTAYQKAHHYHCDGCTRNADPEGYRNEVMGYND